MVKGNVLTTYTYDTVNARRDRMVTVNQSQTTLQDLTYDYFIEGTISQITDGVYPYRNSQTFGYDAIHRLASASGGYGNPAYTYNEIGNMTVNERVGTGTYTYPQGIVGNPYGPAHPHAVSNAGGISYTYDDNGNLTSGNGRTFTWYYDNKPRTITSGGSTIQYVYDAAGQRVTKIAGATTTYIGKLYECTGATCTSYIFGGDTRIARMEGSTLTYYHQDHLGSTAAMSDASGIRVGDYAYYPYGETLTASGSEKYRFTSQEQDAETGLYNYNARHYDPVLGRFASPDAIVQDFSDPQTLNRYSYCRNNPVMYVDPSGHLFGIDDLTIGILLISMAKGAAIGAGVGAGVSAATGGDIGMGALTGAIGGAIFGGAGAIVHGLEAAGGITSAAKAGIHAAAGAMSGGINAGITGGDIGVGMLSGGLAAGISTYVGVEFLPDNDAIQVGGRVLLGGAIGGATSAALGGDFGQGAIVGGAVALFGELLNDLSSPDRARVREINGKYWISYDGKRWVEASPEDQARYRQGAQRKAEQKAEIAKVKNQITIGALAGVAAVALGGEAALTVYLSNPSFWNDAISNYVPGTPPVSSAGGLLGSTAGWATDLFRKK